MSKKKFIILVGMHRSGTTALAKLLDKNGVNMGPFCDPNKESRLYGYDIVFFLNYLGGTWDNPYKIREDNYGKGYESAKEAFLKQIERRRKVHNIVSPFSRLIGFKHPIASLLLPELKEINDSLVICIDRDIEPIIKSLSHRTPPNSKSWFPGQFPYYKYAKNTDELNKLTNYYKRQLNDYESNIDLRLKYENLINPEKMNDEISKLSELIGINICVPDDYFNIKIN